MTSVCPKCQHPGTKEERDLPIPPLDAASGLLPSGRHACIATEIKTAFVDAFPGSGTRSAIFEGWELHLAALQEYLDVFRQWLDGSFVTSKEDPLDVDIVTFLDGPKFDALLPHQKNLMRTLLLNKYTRAFWKVDSYPVPVYPAGSPAHPGLAQAERYWDRWFGHDRTGLAKGYLEVHP